MSGRGVCVHGHFYQPPRENPWTREIDTEPSAAPWNNWNERIADECYGPNTRAAVHGPRGQVRRHDNFAAISFDVGPTLMAWLRRDRPDIHDAIVAADAAAAARPGGHGGAIAQVHDHIIMPLADDRDRRTQVRWGLADFRRRFGREAEGMWLPETAVDIPSLESLAAAGVRFTVLAPHQAARVRAPGGDWEDPARTLETGRAYRQRLPSGREIAIFFYDGALSRDVAFNGVLHDGVEFARRLRGLAYDGDAPSLGHIATDGESYGHHHRYGEMALARALDLLARDEGVELTNYGAWLARHPPKDEVEIAENTSWSCMHGVRRWAGGCDCGTGGAGWDYGWRAPLRRALDGLRQALGARYEAEAGAFFREPGDARDDHAELWLGNPAARDDWWRRHLRPGADRTAGHRLLAMEHAAMRMFTSCGWFFDDPAGLETRQVLRYAARAIDLAGLVGVDGEPVDAPPVAELMAELEQVRSNRVGEWTGADELRRILREDRPRAEPGDRRLGAGPFELSPRTW